ncbi:hypothetical protein DPMN_169999 [Dreissena polymorpha]|uniref:Uncharacterized protein n=1 Tax=Dreissena polymorpha TaxID=45954 RepID=A0A9D4DYY6_DREPO|nr:hypothetical protein DPMN_169999 [Dreissena polymorpha]
MQVSFALASKLWETLKTCDMVRSLKSADSELSINCVPEMPGESVSSFKTEGPKLCLCNDSGHLKTSQTFSVDSFSGVVYAYGSSSN